MTGIIGYVAALADDLAVATAKVPTGVINDDVNQTSKLLSTTGILIDDTAIPQCVSNTAAKRELPVIWKITTQ